MLGRYTLTDIPTTLATSAAVASIFSGITGGLLNIKNINKDKNMLGRYDDRRLSGVVEMLKTTDDVQQTLKEVLPTVKIIAKDYEKASPLVNFLIDYWPIALVILTLVITGSSFAGSYWVMKKLKKG